MLQGPPGGECASRDPCGGALAGGDLPEDAGALRAHHGEGVGGQLAQVVGASEQRGPQDGNASACRACLEEACRQSDVAGAEGRLAEMRAEFLVFRDIFDARLARVHVGR